MLFILLSQSFNERQHLFVGGCLMLNFNVNVNDNNNNITFFIGRPLCG